METVTKLYSFSDIRLGGPESLLIFNLFINFIICVLYFATIPLNTDTTNL